MYVNLIFRIASFRVAAVHHHFLVLIGFDGAVVWFGETNIKADIMIIVVVSVVVWVPYCLFVYLYIHIQSTSSNFDLFSMLCYCSVLLLPSII